MAPWLAALLIVAGLIATGPLVTGSGLAGSGESQKQLAVGGANVTLINTPYSTVLLEKGRFGSEEYTLRVPDATVNVDSVSGDPLLTYKIQMTELGYAKSSIHFLNPSSEGQLTLSIPPTSIDSERIQNDTYTAELSIVLRASGKQTLYQENVTVHVER